jgi:hypothetical protein
MLCRGVSSYVQCDQASGRATIHHPQRPVGLLPGCACATSHADTDDLDGFSITIAHDSEVPAQFLAYNRLACQADVNLHLLSKYATCIPDWSTDPSSHVCGPPVLMLDRVMTSPQCLSRSLLMLEHIMTSPQRLSRSRITTVPLVAPVWPVALNNKEFGTSCRNCLSRV